MKNLDSRSLINPLGILVQNALFGFLIAALLKYVIFSCCLSSVSLSL